MPRHSVFFAKSLYTALNLSAAALIAVRAYRVAADRLAWALIAAGMACSASGDVVYALWVPDGQSPSAADPEYLAFYPLRLCRAAAAHAVTPEAGADPDPARFPGVRVGHGRGGRGAAAGPIHAAAIRAPATVLVGLIYPWGDLVLLALAAGMLPILGWRNEFRWVLLVAGFVGFAVADTAYLFETSAGSYRVGTMLDALWPASSLLVAMASWAPRSSAAPVTETRARLLRRAGGVHRRGAGSRRRGSQLTTRDDSRRVEPGRGRRAILGDLPRRQHAGRKPQAGHDRRVDRAAQSAFTGDGPDRRCPAPASAGLTSATRTSSRRALLLLNLYEFQEINDSVGRHFGDELLCHIANRLSNCVRREDLLARVSDDEFAILLAEGSDLIAARAQAGRLLEALERTVRAGSDHRASRCPHRYRAVPRPL